MKGEQQQEEEEEEGGISAPLVLSQERREEVRRRFHSLEEHLKKLQVTEKGGDEQKESWDLEEEMNNINYDWDKDG